MLAITVVYATPQRQKVIAVDVPIGTNLARAVQLSAIANFFPELDFLKDTLILGVFGQVLPATQLVQAGDRVEVYRPLLIDPMTARRQRAKGKS